MSDQNEPVSDSQQSITTDSFPDYKFIYQKVGETPGRPIPPDYPIGVNPVPPISLSSIQSLREINSDSSTSKSNIREVGVDEEEDKKGTVHVNVAYIKSIMGSWVFFSRSYTCVYRVRARLHAHGRFDTHACIHS